MSIDICWFIKHKRLGYRMLHHKLLQSGFNISLSVTKRLYKEENLILRRRKRKKKLKNLMRDGAWCPVYANQRWSFDFMSDSLQSGVSIRLANLKDDCTRECPLIYVDLSITAETLVELLDFVGMERGYPDILTIDNGPELTGRTLDHWAHEHGVELYFIEPGKPTQNGYIESFNGRFREECLNMHIFQSVAHAQEIVEQYRIEYNQSRPHSSINYMTPNEFAEKRRRIYVKGEMSPELKDRLAPFPLAINNHITYNKKHELLTDKWY